MTKTGKSDPLVEALIAKLPDTEDWDIDKQMSWLHMMAIAFGTIYGGNAASRLIGLNVGQQTQPPKPTSPAKTSFQPAVAKFPFVIDEDGFARHQDGTRIMPEDVTDTIIDLRGQGGDMRTVTWVDGSMGVNGVDLNIACA